MPKVTSRSRKVSEQIKRELAVLINTEVKDPRVNLVTLNAVETSSDLGQAKVYVTSLQTTIEHKELIDVLNSMAGFLRSALGKLMTLRVVPKLKFIYDESIERGAELSKLIDSALAEDRQKAHSDSDDENPSDLPNDIEKQD